MSLFLIDHELRHKIEAGEKPVLLDLCPTAELNANQAMIRGAIHVEAEKLVNQSDRFAKDSDIVVFCSRPNEVTSARFAMLLQKQCLRQNTPLQGGIEAWRKLDYPMAAWSSTSGVAGRTHAAIERITHKIGKTS